VLTLSFLMNPSADKVSWPISKVYRDGTAFTNWGVKLETASTPGHKLAFYMGYGTGRKYIYANSPWVVGQPQHYTIVAYSDGGVGIYLNGQLDKYQAGVAGQKILPSTKRDLAIGTFANGPSPTDDFAGLFDNVNIWHQALSDGEIQEVYQMAIPEPASGLLAILGALVMVRRRSNRCCY
jgi:hypothetical protein